MRWSERITSMCRKASRADRAGGHSSMIGCWMSTQIGRISGRGKEWVWRGCSGGGGGWNETHLATRIDVSFLRLGYYTISPDIGASGTAARRVVYRVCTGTAQTTGDMYMCMLYSMDDA